MLLYQTRIKVLPCTQYFKKIITKIGKYSTDDEIQGHTCKNVTRNISAKIHEPFLKYSTKSSK